MADEQQAPQIELIFGNTRPHMQYTTAEGMTFSSPAKHINQSETHVVFEPGIEDPERVEHTLSTENDRMLTLIARTLSDEEKRYALAIAQMEDIVRVHAGGEKPAWVTSTDLALAKAVAGFYNCPVSTITNVDGHDIAGPTALLTNGGRDNLHSEGFNTSAPPATANYIALTANATAASATDTTLTAEIATASGGLIRAQATYAHTGGTNTTTLTKTFTANGSDVLPVTLAKIGVFNAASVGTMVFETLLSSTATLNVSGDNVTITETITLG